VDDDEKEEKTVKESYLSDTLAKRPASNVGIAGGVFIQIKKQ